MIKDNRYFECSLGFLGKELECKINNMDKEKPVKKTGSSSEHKEQSMLFTEIKKRAVNDNRYNMIFAIPNGSQRNKITAFNLKKEGVKKGVPDIFVSVPAGAYHGLYIEMKYGYNKLTNEQSEFIQYASEYNYKCVVCYSYNEAITQIERYFEYSNI